MKLGFSCDGKYYCFLCDYQFSEKDVVGGRVIIHEHFKRMHHRTMIAENVMQGKAGVSTTYTGPYFGKEEER